MTSLLFRRAISVKECAQAHSHKAFLVYGIIFLQTKKETICFQMISDYISHHIDMRIAFQITKVIFAPPQKKDQNGGYDETHNPLLAT